ncbi:hypothetical protein D1007_40550 [Hordeum vulgare]|nr:hypothetical protein D1007_40550 [Hordeum vulgare]
MGRGRLPLVEEFVFCTLGVPHGGIKVPYEMNNEIEEVLFPGEASMPNKTVLATSLGATKNHGKLMYVVSLDISTVNFAALGASAPPHKLVMSAWTYNAIKAMLAIERISDTNSQELPDTQEDLFGDSFGGVKACLDKDGMMIWRMCNMTLIIMNLEKFRMDIPLIRLHRLYQHPSVKNIVARAGKPKMKDQLERIQSKLATSNNVEIHEPPAEKSVAVSPIAAPVMMHIRRPANTYPSIGSGEKENEQMSFFFSFQHADELI